jgi:hypothetical protein
VDGTGNVVLTGYFQPFVDLGGGLLTSFGTQDIFVAKYASANGAYLWSDQFGGTGYDNGNGVAVDSAGDIVVTGFFQNVANFGGLSLTSVGSNDFFISKLTP